MFPVIRNFMAAPRRSASNPSRRMLSGLGQHDFRKQVSLPYGHYTLELERVVGIAQTHPTDDTDPLFGIGKTGRRSRLNGYNSPAAFDTAKLDDDVDHRSGIGNGVVAPKAEPALHNHQCQLFRSACRRIGVNGREGAGMAGVDGT